MFKEYELVRLLQDIPGSGVYKGMIGTIVMIYNEQKLLLAYEVEFCNDKGKTIALVTLKSNEIESINANQSN